MEENNNDYILELQNLSKSFGKNQVLKGVNLKVRRGSVMGLMGENGAGKSTMMKVIFGIHQHMMAEATQFFKDIGIQVDLKAKMKTMSVAQRQMVEIAKAVSYNAKVIVLDEPTSSLTDNEVEKLFSTMSDLKKKGISFIYI